MSICNTYSPINVITEIEQHVITLSMRWQSALRKADKLGFTWRDPNQLGTALELEGHGMTYVFPIRDPSRIESYLNGFETSLNCYLDGVEKQNG